MESRILKTARMAPGLIEPRNSRRLRWVEAVGDCRNATPLRALDHVVLFIGDGDFRALVGAMQMRGRRVSVVSTLKTQPPMVADELRRQADQFIDLADLEEQICRDRATRAVASPVRETRTSGPNVSGGTRLPDDEEDEGH